MRDLLVIIISVLYIASLNLQANAINTIPPIGGKWKLVLNEEFNEFNPKLWSKGDSWKDPIPPRNAINFFNDENLEFLDGKILLNIKKDELVYLKKDKSKAKYDYSTGAINSFGKFKFKYGYIEASIKAPSSEGLWSAFWLMPDRRFQDSDKVQKGIRSTFIESKNDKYLSGRGMEIDIMEQLSEWDHHKFSYALHWDGYKEAMQSFEGRYTIKHKRSDFVRFGLYWAPKQLIWFANGEKVAEYRSDRIADVPMYIILNNFVGGWAKQLKEYSGLPDAMVVDYLRVWQRTNAKPPKASTN